MKHIIFTAYLIIAISFTQCDNSDDSAGYVGQPVVCPTPEYAEVGAEAGTYRIELARDTSIRDLYFMAEGVDDESNITKIEHKNLIYPFSIDECWATVTYTSSQVIEVSFTKNETNCRRWVEMHFATPFALGESACIMQQAGC